MLISLTHRILAATCGLCLLTGCTSAPQPVNHQAAATPTRWEYRFLDGAGSDQSPEAEKLKQAGWVFTGYDFSNGDTMAIDENSEIARRMSYGVVPRNVIRAKFKRAYQ